MSSNVEDVLKSLCENVNSNVEARLKAVSRIIYGFKKNNVDLTVPNVINALKASGVNISASSLYNKTVRGKPNPYRVLFDAWAHDIDKAKLDKVSHDYSPVDFTLMTDADFLAIGSDVVKFKVQTLYNELKSVRHQINMLKQIRDLPVVEDTGESIIFHKNSALSESHSLKEYNNTTVIKNQDVEMHMGVINQFMSSNNKLKFDEDGCLVAKATIRKGDILSDLDFKEAMEAALRALLDK